MENEAQNTLELARQGDPSAIAIILTYYLSQQSNATASAIRLGNYLSVLIDVSFATAQERLVNLVLSILTDLQITGISVVEISARQLGDREVQWSQTIELADSHVLNGTMTELTNADLIDSSSTDAPVSSELATAERSPDSPATATPSPEDWTPSLYTFFQRPELVALLAFAMILVFWDIYLEWMGEIDATQPLTGVKLARRLGVSTSTLSRFKGRANFSDWSRELDPDGIAWSYENKLFVPQVYAYSTPTQEWAGLSH